MKSGLLLILVLVGLIGGVTFVSHYNWHSRSPTDPQSGLPRFQPALAPLKFPVTRVQWDPQDPEYVAEVELTGFYDFSFENLQNTPVQLGLAFKSCACAQIKAATFTPEEWKELRQRAPVAGAAQALAAPGGLPSLIGTAALANREIRRLLDDQERWQPLELGDTKGMTVPAADSAIGPAGGLVRMSWKSTKMGPERLVADIWEQVGQDNPERERLEVPVVFVPPFGIYPTEVIKIDKDLNFGEQGNVEFVCWSATRANLTVTAQERREDPCFVCVCTPLTDEQRQTLAQTLKVRVRSGYRVNVTVHERLSNVKQLDLGPFQRHVVLASPGLDPIVAVVTGTVRGGVRVGTEDDHDQVDLGSFLADAGKAKTIALAANQAGLRLELDNKIPEFLHVKLEEVKAGAADGKQLWNLHVEVPPNRAAGTLPPNSAVLLKSSYGDSSRRIRIPVKGNAYRK